MTDWADRLADDLVRGIADKTINRPIIAARLRALWDEAQTKAITAATEEIKHVFAEHGVGGGDK